jgi:[acyl-carrier-protein] S-malonyltransferase
MGKNVVIFPGQGSQKVGMGRDVAEECTAAADVFRRADDILGFGLSKICFEGPAEELTPTDVQQPAIFATSVAIWEAMRERGVPVDSLLEATAGLSLGEYTALYAAGSISFEDGLRLVRRRGELMQEAATAVSSGMVSLIGGDESNAVSLCEAAAGGEVLVPANFNCPGQIVISGAKSACDRAVDLAREHGVRAIALDVAGAFHSPLMQAAADQLGAVLADVEIKTPKCAVIANVDATPHTDPDSIREKLQRQVTHAVRWMDSIQMLREQGFAHFVEVGPGRVLTGMMRKIDRSAKAVNVSTAEQLDAEIVDAAAG